MDYLELAQLYRSCLSCPVAHNGRVCRTVQCLHCDEVIVLERNANGLWACPTCGEVD